MDPCCLVDEKIYFKYCEKFIQQWSWGEICRLKEHLDCIIIQVSPCMAPLEEIGQIIFELQNQHAKFEEDMARKNEMVVCFSNSKV
jgi:hypothetical protein